VLDYTLSIANTVNAFTSFSYTFTNNTSTTHTLQFTNPGNINTCGVIVDDISISKYASPGGIASGSVSLWFKAESITQTNNTDVYAWNSQLGSALTVTAPCANRPVYFTGLASAANNLVANFNPYITFNGTNQYLAYEVARQTLLDASNGGPGTSVFEVYQGGTVGRTLISYRGTDNSRIEGKTDSLIFSTGTTAGTNNNLGYSHNTRVNIVAATGKKNGLTISDLNGQAQTLSNNSIDSEHLSIGARKANAGTFGRYFNGSISEIIFVNGPLTETPMHRIRSYLGMKYGVTFNDNSNTTIDERSFQSSNGTVLWDYSTNTNYHNNVTVIGRDDANGLNQKRSISTNADAGSNTGNAILDIDNVNDFTADQSFLAVGHNGTAIPDPGGADFSDVPTGIQSRLRRVWKFVKTGTGVANNVNVRFDMTGFSPLTGTNLRLIVSTTTVFAGASVIAGSYAAPYFTASLPTTGGVYFTLASTNSVTTPLPIELISFEGVLEENIVKLNWKTASETNNSHFELEKSNDGFEFKKIAALPSKGLNGSSNSLLTYTAIDADLTEKLYYYRLKQVDLDGSFKYSSSISVKIYSPELKIYPNPNNGAFWIDVPTAKTNQKVSVKIYDQLSNEVLNNEYSVVNDNITGASVKIEPSKPLPKGAYMALILFEGTEYRLKMVVN
jgi:hypothetical protein